MDTVSGLPSHPLFVHAPVVLMPLAALAAIALAIRPRWRRRSSVALAVGAAVVLVSTQLAVRSGTSFDEVVGDRVDTDRHKSLALTTRKLVALFLVSSVGTAVLDVGARRRIAADDPSWHRPATGAAVAATVITALLAVIWMVRTGDEGARLVWEGVVEE